MCIVTIKGFSIDADPMNADWTKQTWDLPATNLAELMEMLTETHMSADEFKQLPVYLLNVDKLEWLQDL
jgi:hypothetical protein